MTGLVVAALVAVACIRLVDRLTDAPVMRRRVNAGTARWQERERARARADRAGDSWADDTDGDGDSDGDGD